MHLTFAVIVFAGMTVVRADDGDPQEDNRLGPSVKLLDSDGRALKGAWVGVGAHCESEKTPSWSPYSPHGISMEDGIARLAGRSLPQGQVVLYARHEGRNLCGIQSFDPEQLTAGVEMKLRPACRVHGELQSRSLKAAGQKLGWTNVYLYEGASRPLSFSSQENRFEFHLPPGKYRLNAYGTGTLQVDREIEVGLNQRELALSAVDLPATKLATLMGKPAPELQEIREWSNSSPVRLKDLRGKYVLLTFWGQWCGPCLREIPHLMKLHDAFGDRGLVVLSVHDASVESIAEMESKLEAAREREWWGREIPFPVALDGGNAPDTKPRPTGRGATTDAYGITTFPTTLLIDREGKIVEEAAAWDARLPDRFDSLLGTDGKLPTWRQRLDEVYQFDPGQVVRRIAPPFIPERTPFITAEYNVIGGVGRYPERLTLLWDGKLRRRDAGAATLIEVLRSVADWSERDSALECPADLAKRVIPGDWIVAADAPLAERFSALETVLRQELRQRIRLVKAQVEREVVVVSGKYGFRPLRPGDSQIHISTNDGDLDDLQGGGGGPIKDFLEALTLMVQAPCIDETTDSADLKLLWAQHPSAILNRPAPAKEVDLILAKLAKQTSLKFERQRRMTDVWLVREAP